MWIIAQREFKPLSLTISRKCFRPVRHVRCCMGSDDKNNSGRCDWHLLNPHNVPGTVLRAFRGLSHSIPRGTLWSRRRAVPILWMRKQKIREVTQLDRWSLIWAEQPDSGCQLAWLPCSVSVWSYHWGTARQYSDISPRHWVGTCRERGVLSCFRELASFRQRSSWGQQEELSRAVRGECSLTTSSCNPVIKATEMGCRDSSGLCLTSLPVWEPLLVVALALPFTSPSVHAQGASHCGKLSWMGTVISTHN